MSTRTQYVILVLFVLKKIGEKKKQKSDWITSYKELSRIILVVELIITLLTYHDNRK